MYGNMILVGSQYSDDSTGSAYIANIVGCSIDYACNYNADLWINDSLCEYPLNNFDCDGVCYDEIDECGVCGGFGVSGDINYDSNIDIVDIVLIIDYIVQSNIYHVNSCSVDMNSNGVINITDIILLLELILND